MTDVQNNLPQADTSNQDNDQQLKAKRKKALSLVAVIIVLILAIYLSWKFIFNHTVSTDNAYVGAETASITSMLTGQVEKVFVSDTQHVQQGQLLVQIDPRDAEIAVQQARAELLKVQRQFKQTQANSSALNAQVDVSDDAIKSAEFQSRKAQADLSKVQEEYQRRVQLRSSGAISQEELGTSKNAVNTAKAALDVANASLAQAKSSHKAARSTLDANQALIQGATEHSTPDVLMAQAKLNQALLDLERTKIIAPLDGIVTNRKIQIGQRVSPGSVLMAIVPEKQVYVDANFKESQLERVKAGQKVKLISDYYGSSVEFNGTVVGFSGGTGSAFALIPAQNATGNWIKVVQRLPIRIQLDPKELAEHPLRVGLSMEASIDLNSK